jgi:hypothetical protein
MLKLVLILGLSESKTAQVLLTIAKTAVVALLLCYPIAWLFGFQALSVFDLVFLVGLALDLHAWFKFYKRKAWVENLNEVQVEAWVQERLKVLEAGA